MSIHKRRIMEAARELGITVTDLQETWHMDALRLTWGGRTELICNEGLGFSDLSHHAYMIARNKYATKQMLKELGIPVPEGMVFDRVDAMRPAVASLMEDYSPVVCKPLDAAEGDSILMNITDLDTVLRHAETVLENYESVLVEQQVDGDDLRIHVIDGRPEAVCRRIPAQVTGDGAATLAQLIEKELVRVRRDNPENDITLDEQVDQLISRQGVVMTDVIEHGRTIQLKTIANMSQGARAVDITDTMHPDYGLWTKAIADRLGLTFYSVDVLTTDHTAPPANHAVVLEINGEAAWLHHTFSDGKQHPYPHRFLKRLFQME
ncbi:MAG: hypothetical protein QNK37_18575 [Acidobacteriota bacterium]|nr:hypothetical protein [Acidobacteriota bacterium]